jgi:hypothetical protein
MIGKTCTRCMLPPLGYSQRMPCCGSLGHLRFSQVRNLGHQLQPLRCGGPTTLPHLDLRETGHAASRCPICGYERICMAESKSQSRSRLRHPAEIPMRSVMICDPWSRAFGENGQDQFEMQAALASLFLMLLQVHHGSSRWIPTLQHSTHSTSASRNFETCRKSIWKSPKHLFVHASSVLCPIELLNKISLQGVAAQQIFGAVPRLWVSTKVF